MRVLRCGVIGAVALVSAVPVSGRQVVDTAYTPVVERPEYEGGAGPRILIDAAHLNFHTADGGYAPFAKLLRLDGYRVDSNSAPFIAEVLARADVLVIVNAMHKQSEESWGPLPNESAFTDAEIVEVEKWVGSGGALLLIADHMPLAGHAEALAAAFGVRFYNGFAFDSAGSGTITFRRSDGSLASGLIADGRGDGERVESVTTFTGQAFRLDPDIRAEPLMILPEGSSVLLPEVAFTFSDRTPRAPAAHLLQGALVHHGQGRVAVLGEAAMFSAQLGGPDRRPIGMNAPEAGGNSRFALNLMRWLSGALR